MIKMEPTFSRRPGWVDRKPMFVSNNPPKYPSQTPRLIWRLFAALLLQFLPVMVVRAGGAVTNGYITAVLRSECASDPTPPPPVGSTSVGTDYVIMTVADADPTDFSHAQEVVTNAIFESLMPLYCALLETTNNCVTKIESM